MYVATFDSNCFTGNRSDSVLSVIEWKCNSFYGDMCNAFVGFSIAEMNTGQQDGGSVVLTTGDKRRTGEAFMYCFIAVKVKSAEGLHIMMSEDFKAGIVICICFYNIDKSFVKPIMIKVVTIVLQPWAQGMADQATAFAGSAKVGGGPFCSSGLLYMLWSPAPPPFFLSFFVPPVIAYPISKFATKGDNTVLFAHYD